MFTYKRETEITYEQLDQILTHRLTHRQKTTSHHPKFCSNPDNRHLWDAGGGEKNTCTLFCWHTSSNEMHSYCITSLNPTHVFLFRAEGHMSNCESTKIIYKPPSGFTNYNCKLDYICNVSGTASATSAITTTASATSVTSNDHN